MTTSETTTIGQTSDGNNNDAINANTNSNSNSNNSNNTNNTTDDGSNVNVNIKSDIVLSLKTIPEYDQYPFSMAKEKFYLMASIKAPYFRAENRAPLDLVCVIDESGSMSGERIRLVRETVFFIVKNLESKDRFACVGYASSSRIICPLTKMDTTGKKNATVAVETIKASGSTALCDGLCTGIDLLRNRGSDCGAVASVLLFTDGQATNGPTTAVGIIQAMSDPKWKSGSRMQGRGPPQQMYQQNMVANFVPPPPAPVQQLQQQFQQQQQQQQQQRQGYSNVQPIQQQQQQAPPQLYGQTQGYGQMQQQQQQQQMQGYAQPQQQIQPQMQGYGQPPQNLNTSAQGQAPQIQGQIPQIQGQAPTKSMQSMSSNNYNSNSNSNSVTSVPGQAPAPPSKPVDDNKEKEGERNTLENNDITENGLPCTVNTFGFGQGHNSSILEAIAEHGRGMYAYIKNTEMVAETFAECVGGLVSIIGQNLQIKMEALNDVEIVKCLSQGFAIRQTRPRKEITVTIDDIQSEESRDLVFELSLPALEAEQLRSSIIQFSVTYQNMITSSQQVLSIVCNIDRVQGSDIGERNIELDQQYNRLLAADAMDKADKMAQSGKLDQARQTLKEAQVQIQSSRTNKSEYCVNLVQDIAKCSSKLQSQQQYNQYGKNMLKMNKKAHYMQRSVQSSQYQAQQCYTNSSKYAMMSKFSSK